jgi:hypothetical protein
VDVVERLVDVTPRARLQMMRVAEKFPAVFHVDAPAAGAPCRNARRRLPENRLHRGLDPVGLLPLAALDLEDAAEAVYQDVAVRPAAEQVDRMHGRQLDGENLRLQQLERPNVGEQVAPEDAPAVVDVEPLEVVCGSQSVDGRPSRGAFLREPRIVDQAGALENSRDMRKDFSRRRVDVFVLEFVEPEDRAPVGYWMRVENGITA